MNDRNAPNAAGASRALAARVLKSVDIRSGAVKIRAVKSRTRKRPGAAPPPSNSIVTCSSAYIEPEIRDAMIAEGAYFRSARRGFEPGHEVVDWLAAESEIDAALTRGDLPQFMSS
jgi:hypothetical protein